jgi:hypothetical protein
VAEFSAEIKDQPLSHEFPSTRAMLSAMKTTKQGEIQITRLSERSFEACMGNSGNFQGCPGLPTARQEYTITLAIDLL